MEHIDANTVVTNPVDAEASDVRASFEAEWFSGGEEPTGETGGMGLLEAVAGPCREEAAQEEAPGEIPGEAPGEDAKENGILQELNRVRNARNNERAQYERAMQEAQPYSQVGKLLIGDVTGKLGCSVEQAVELLTKNHMQAVAEREGVPAYLLAEMERMRGQLGAQQPQKESPDLWAARIREEAANTQMPEGFDFEAAKEDQAFVEMLMEMPVKRAAELYHYQRQAEMAPRRIADQLKARQAIPQTERPGAPVQAKVDFMAMSDREFDEYEARIRRYR